MNSGIYRLTFSSGYFYIGKSINIPSRWQQHELKFRTHKAAKRMQEEYDLCGSPKKEVLMLCHADHIDIVETWLIDQFYQENGAWMLNATYAEPVGDPDRKKLNRDIGLLRLSTADHVDLICTLREDESEELKELREEHEKTHAELHTAQQKLQQLRDSGFRVPEEVLEQEQTLEGYRAHICELELENTEAVQQVINLTAELHRLKTRPWWKRLFS